MFFSWMNRPSDNSSRRIIPVQFLDLLHTLKQFFFNDFFLSFFFFYNFLNFKRTLLLDLSMKKWANNPREKKLKTKLEKGARPDQTRPDKKISKKTFQKKNLSQNFRFINSVFPKQSWFNNFFLQHFFLQNSVFLKQIWLQKKSQFF